MEDQKRRGPSASAKAAEKHLTKNPSATAKELAKKFKIDVSTVYRSPWWVNRKDAQAAQQSEGE